jgi:pimeloyl-ACP methyl ester carboxylesterase
MQGWRVVLFAILLATGSGAMASAQGTPDATPQSIDGLYDVGGGRQIYLKCTGSGGPTVVFISGWAGDSSTFYAVAPTISTHTRTCVYDRAGLGESDPAPNGVRTIDESAQDLHAALTAAGITDQIVLAGWSYGGMIARTYAALFPDHVAGMVLIEATPPGWASASIDLFEDEGVRGYLTTFYSGLEEGDPERLDILNAPPDIPARSSDSAIPVIALVRSTSERDVPPDWDEAMVDAWHTTWIALQEEQAADELAELRVVLGSDHAIPSKNPQAVIDAVLDVLSAIGESTNATPAA